MRPWIVTAAVIFAAFLTNASAFASAIDCGSSNVIDQNYPPTPSPPLCTASQQGTVDLYKDCINSANEQPCAIYWTEYYNMVYSNEGSYCSLVAGYWDHNIITSDSCGD